MFVDDVNNARRHGKRNNSKDNGEGLVGPTDGLIQRPLLIQEADGKAPAKVADGEREEGSGLVQGCTGG